NTYSYPYFPEEEANFSDKPRGEIGWPPLPRVVLPRIQCQFRSADLSGCTIPALLDVCGAATHLFADPSICFACARQTDLLGHAPSWHLIAFMAIHCR